LLGPGASTAPDIRLFRSGTKQLTWDNDGGGGFITHNLDIIDQSTQSAGTTVHTTAVSGDTQKRFILKNTGIEQWGPGGSTATDLQFSRTGVSTGQFDNAAGGGAATIKFDNIKGVQTNGAVKAVNNGTAAFEVDTNGVIFDNATGSYTAAALNYNEGPTTVSTTFGGAFANTAFNLIYSRTHNTITVRWPDIQAACTAASQITAAAGQIPTRFCPPATTRMTTLGANAGAVQDQPVGIDFKHDGSISIYLKPTSVNFTSGAGLCGPYASHATWTFA
jgi:hypothetical protein